MRVAISVQTKSGEAEMPRRQSRSQLGLQGPGSITADLVLDRDVEARVMLILRGQHAVKQVGYLGPDCEHGRTAERQSGERCIGVDPTSGKNVYVRLARYGPIAQIGDADDENKRQKGLPGNLSIETVTLEQALELFKFPRVIGLFEEAPMEVKLGRFGPYIEHNKAFYSLPKEDDPYSIEGPRGIEVILARRQKIAENTIKTFDEDPSVKVLKGRWGPYIVVGKQNVRIPKDTNAEALTLEDCLQLAAQQAPAKPAKKSAAKAAKAEPAAKPAKKAVKKAAKKAVKKTTTAVKKTAAKKSSK